VGSGSRWRAVDDDADDDDPDDDDPFQPSTTPVRKGPITPPRRRDGSFEVGDIANASWTWLLPEGPPNQRSESRSVPSLANVGDGGCASIPSNGSAAR